MRRAADCVRSGGLLAYPTEAVWGLGCHPFDPNAVERLRQLKQRPDHQGLILVGESADQFAPWLEPLDATQQATLQRSWPGPLTWLVPSPNGPRWLTGDSDKIALRVTNHPLVAALCQILGGPIVSTSANPRGRPPARSAIKVRHFFGQHIDGLLAGSTQGAQRPSEIRDLVTGVTVRAA